MIDLIAEIKGKISSTGSNLSERLEDKLTGDFFGSLRYIPFNKVAKQIILKTRFLYEGSAAILKEIENIDASYWNHNIEFWPSDPQGELDVLMDFDNIVIGIEVKLYSGLSSDDDIVNLASTGAIDSRHQLSRESRILKKKILGADKKALLIFIAPEHICYPICREACDRNIIEHGVVLGYIPWEEILVTLEESIDKQELNDFERLIIKDIVDLLKRKGLERFRSFNIECPNIDGDLWFCFDYYDIDFSFIYHIAVEDCCRLE